MRRLPAALAPLSQPTFRLLWIGQSISAVGDALVPVALAFATLSIAHSASAIGPAISSVLVATVGPAWSSAIEPPTFVGRAAPLAFLAVPPLSNPQRQNFWTELGDGIRAVASRVCYELDDVPPVAWNFA